MLKKGSLIIALLVAVTVFGLTGTSVAGEPVNFDEAQISLWANASNDNDGVQEFRYIAPAGVISNLDHTTANFDDGLYVEDNAEYKIHGSVQCFGSLGAISNLDHTTARLDAGSCS